MRFFSPDVEVDLCGHSTIATFFAMALEGVFSRNIKTVVTQETKVGVLPVDIYFSDEDVDRVMMTQATPRYKDIFLDIFILADSLNILVDEIDGSLPKQTVSTGFFTSPLCVKSFDILKAINPDFEKFKKLCRRLGVGSYHIFTFDTIEPNLTYHARNFAPFYGVNEDPVTGTANGAVCSYLIKNKLVKDRNLIC